jgi:uncharacterized protein involved in exopolysaccharide biosynthesis
VTFATATGSDIVDVTASAKSGKTAAAIANAFANAYVTARTADITAELNAAQAKYQSQIDAVVAQIQPLDATLAAAANAPAAQLAAVTSQVEPERTALLAQQQTLQTELNNLSSARILNNADPSVVAPATPPTGSSLSGLAIYAMGGLLLGLLIGGAVSLLLDRKWGRIRTEADVAVKGVVIPFVAVVGPSSRRRDMTPSPADVTRVYRRVGGELMGRPVRPHGPARRAPGSPSRSPPWDGRWD